MMNRLQKYGLDSLELKALSVPSSLRFLLGVEYDVVLSVTEAGARRPFRLHFPVLSSAFRKLLALCASRFGLSCEHSPSGSLLSGVAVMPVLRYADYLPGSLHVGEILECLQVSPAHSVRRWSGGDAEAAESSAAGYYEFEASFIDYSEFNSDSSLEDVHGQGFYLMLDYGLCLATHGHLIGIQFHKDWDATQALREFQEFSGWEKFDLRFQDEQQKHEGGVIVMPSIQDVTDLLERYEDEDSDDEGDLLPFILRPVAPLVPVPALEDSALRRLRDQYWTEVEQHWAGVPGSCNTVVVFNLYENATLEELLLFFSELPIVSSELVEDNSPMRRRRLFLELKTAEAAQKALKVDGRNTRGSTLRVQVAPPYISASRRGRAVVADAEACPTFSVSLHKKSSNAATNKKTAVAPSPSSSPKAAREASSPSSRAREDSAAGGHHVDPAGAKAELTAPSAILPVGASNMNITAKEFVPLFKLSANSPEYHPSEPPAVDAAYNYAVEGALPPPPAYNGGRSPQGTYGSAPSSAHLGHLSSNGPLLPAYSLPPPYLGDGEAASSSFGHAELVLPPPYSGE